MNIYIYSTLIAVAAVWLCRIIGGRFASACFFYFVPWIGSLWMFAIYGGTEAVPFLLSEQSIDLVEVAMWSAAVGFVLGAVLSRMMGATRPRIDEQFDAWLSFIARWGISLGVIYSVIGVGYLVYNLMRFNFSLNSIRLAHTGAHEGGALLGYSEAVVNYVVMTAFILLSMSIIAMLRGGKNAKKTTVLLLIAYAGQAMSVGGRIYIVVPFVFGIAVIALLPGGLAQMVRRMGWRLAAFGLVVLYLFNAVIVLRGGRGEFTIKDTFEDFGQKTILAPFIYNTCSIVALDLHANAVDPGESYGYYTFDAFYRTACKMGCLTDYKYADFFNLDLMKNSSIREISGAGWSQPGAVPKLISDFGYVGMPIVLALFCCLSQVIAHRWAVVSPVKCTVAAWMLLCCAYTIQSVHWFSMQSLVMLLSALWWNFVAQIGSATSPRFVCRSN